MWLVRLLLSLALVGLVILFGLGNNYPHQKVDVNLQPLYYNYTQVPLLTVVAISVIAGLLIATIMFALVYLRQSVQLRTHEKNIRALEQEISILRNRPVEESATSLRTLQLTPKMTSVFDEV